MGDYFAGLDLGQASDWTALTIAERWQVRSEEHTVRVYKVGHLERCRHVPYPQIVGRVKALLAAPALKGHTTLVVDATGVGVPVCDMLRQAGIGAPMVPVTITGGTETTRRGVEYSTPKRDLVSALRVLLDARRLLIARELPEAETLTRELERFRVKVSLSGHDSYEAWREGDHDDLVLSCALAVWYAEQQRRGVGFG